MIRRDFTLHPSLCGSCPPIAICPLLVPSLVAASFGGLFAFKMLLFLFFYDVAVLVVSLGRPLHTLAGSFFFGRIRFPDLPRTGPTAPIAVPEISLHFVFDAQRAVVSLWPLLA